MATLELWVDNEDSTGNWTTVGTTPYLSSQNQPTDYIHDTGRNDVSGVYSFETTGQTGTINSVTLYVYCIADSSDTFDTILSASSAGILPGASWGWQSADVSAILTTWAQINSATVYFDRSNTANYGAVDAVYIEVDYTAGANVVRNVIGNA